MTEKKCLHQLLYCVKGTHVRTQLLSKTGGTVTLSVGSAGGAAVWPPSLLLVEQKPMLPQVQGLLPALGAGCVQAACSIVGFLWLVGLCLHRHVPTVGTLEGCCVHCAVCFTLPQL